MVIKNIEKSHLLLENLFKITDTISEYTQLIKIEPFNNVRFEMLSDLKNIIFESVNNMNDMLDKNQKSFICDSNNMIITSFLNIKQSNTLDEIISELELLNECLINTSTSIKIIPDRSIYINAINENFIDNYNQILKSNNRLYETELYCLNNNINESFDSIYDSTLNGLMESLVQKITDTLNKIKLGFGNKHGKLLKRDKKWINDNKKNILSRNYEDIQLEVLTDNTITFENLMNKHNIFDKIFVNSSNLDNLDSKLMRFEDKHGNLKNGLDNYFRTGTSKREVGTRKVAGQEAKKAVENMIAYCESFLAGRNYLDNKINLITSELEKSEKVEESVNYSHIFRNDYSSYIVESMLIEASKGEDEYNDLNEEDVNTSDKLEDVKNKNRTIRDRQLGIAVLLTVAEDRYFDYIKVLHGLAE